MADLARPFPVAIDTTIVSLWTSGPTNMLRFPMTDLVVGVAVLLFRSVDLSETRHELADGQAPPQSRGPRRWAPNERCHEP